MNKKKQVKKLLAEFEQKAREYFINRGIKSETGFSIMRNERGFSLKIPATAFPRDERILDMGFYDFNLFISEFKDVKVNLKANLCVWLKFREGREEGINSDNLRIFDNFASWLGFSWLEKIVALNAAVIDGEVVYSGDGEVQWMKDLEDESN